MNRPPNHATLAAASVIASALLAWQATAPTVQAASIAPAIPTRFLSLLAAPALLPSIAQATSDSSQEKSAPQKSETQSPDTNKTGAAKQGNIPIPDGPGRDTAKRLCSTCHSNNVWAAQRHTFDKWSSIIDNMTSKGMEASDDDLATVNDYLAKYLGPDSTAPTPAAAPAPASAPAPK